MNSNPFKNLFKVDGSYWLLVPSILHTTVPWVQYRLRGLIPFVFAMMWLLPKVSKIIVKFNTREGRVFFKALIWFVFLMFMPEVFAIIGSEEHLQYHKIAMYTMQVIFLVVAFYTIACRKFNELRFLTVITLGGFMFSGILAVRGIGVEGLESGRSMVSLQNAGHMISQKTIDAAINVVEFGLGGYGYMYMCAWIFGIAMFAFAITRSKILKMFYVGAMFSSAVSVKMGGLGTPLGIIAIEIIVFGGWLATFRNRKMVAICGYSLIALFFVYATMPQMFGFLVTPFESIAEIMSEGSFKERVLSMASAFRGEISYANERAMLQMKSFNAFCDHPFMGTFGPFAGGSQINLGGHSYLLDILGGYGLLGLFVFIMFMWSLLKYFYTLGRIYFGDRWLVLPVFFMSIFAFSAIMNPVNFFANAAYLLPGIAWLALSPREKDAVIWRHEQIGWTQKHYGY